MFKHYTTSDNAELIQELKNYYKPYRFSTLYSLHLPELEIGDTVFVHSQLEVTNDLGVNVSLGHAMLLHSRETILDHVHGKPGGTLLSKYAGENVTPGMHHGFRSLAGSARVSVSGDAWASVIVYARTDGAPLGAAIQVMRNYGGLSAIVLRA